jgi:hypothetical protein
MYDNWQSTASDAQSTSARHHPCKLSRFASCIFRPLMWQKQLCKHNVKFDCWQSLSQAPNELKSSTNNRRKCIQHATILTCNSLVNSKIWSIRTRWVKLKEGIHLRRTGCNEHCNLKCLALRICVLTMTGAFAVQSTGSCTGCWPVQKNGFTTRTQATWLLLPLEKA